MGVAHATVTLNHKSNLPRDAVVNTFTFLTPGGDVAFADQQAIRVALDRFYTGISEENVNSLSKYMGYQLSRTVAPVLRIYDVTAKLNGDPAGSPIYVTPMAQLQTELDSNPLPTEMCLAMSFRSDYGPDVEFLPGQRPRSRDRGRIFLGPFQQGEVVVGSGSRPVPSTTLVNVINNCGHALMTDPTVDWVVWSRAKASVASVIEVSVDDAWDVQRSRGERPAARTLAT